MAFRAKVLLSGNAGLKKYSEKISEIWETICRENIIHFLELWLWDDEFEAIGGMEGMVSGINLRSGTGHGFVTDQGESTDYNKAQVGHTAHNQLTTAPISGRQFGRLFVSYDNGLRAGKTTGQVVLPTIRGKRRRLARKRLCDWQATQLILIPQNPNGSRNLPGCDFHPPEPEQRSQLPGCDLYPPEPKRKSQLAGLQPQSPRT
ncbi:hypothetical protein B0H14DRAFT_3149180 [Mycena olivaceomarginata]|nr:hypothetical protein B0H14DRAFT_3149180 [Mycena olivaceomarginata]